MLQFRERLAATGKHPVRGPHQWEAGADNMNSRNAGNIYSKHTGDSKYLCQWQHHVSFSPCHQSATACLAPFCLRLARLMTKLYRSAQRIQTSTRQQCNPERSRRQPTLLQLRLASQLVDSRWRSLPPPSSSSPGRRPTFDCTQISGSACLLCTGNTSFMYANC
jgi:hypothetical protein